MHTNNESEKQQLNDAVLKKTNFNLKLWCAVCTLPSVCLGLSFYLTAIGPTKKDFSLGVRSNIVYRF